jgi:hypothetical protein
MTKKTKIASNVGAILGLAVVGLLVLAALAAGVWHVVESYVSPTAARVWAIVATLLLPVVGRVCYQLGLTESKGKLAGIDAGVSRVTKAAAVAIDLRATSARQMRQATRPDPPVVMLPEPIIEVRPQIESGEVEL